jgi:hypothetical protein
MQYNPEQHHMWLESISEYLEKVILDRVHLELSVLPGRDFFSRSPWSLVAAKCSGTTEKNREMVHDRFQLNAV